MNLQALIAVLESRDELVRIKVEVDPLLEIAAITDRVSKQPDGGKALLFENPAGCIFPVATNLFGSVRRICLALGINSLEQLTTKMSFLLDRIPAPLISSLDSQITSLPEFSCFAPLMSTDVDSDLTAIEPPDLTLLPFLQTWPDDGSVDGFPRYITLPLVFTVDPEGRNPNCGMYGAQVRGATELAMRWKNGSGAAGHLDRYRQCRQKMPVAIVLGGDPAFTFSAMFTLPGTLDEIAFAGYLRGSSMEMIPCRTVPLRVPLNAEVVIEGYVDPFETVVEGPFGNHTGSYSASSPASLLRVTAISCRQNAIIPATVVGPPPMEDCWMAKAWEAVLTGFIKSLVPGVKRLFFPMEWIFNQSAIIFLENPSGTMVRETASLLWETAWFRNARLLIFVEAGQNTSDMSKIAWHCINISEFRRDLFYDKTGLRLALDATACNLIDKKIVIDKPTAERVLQRWQEYGIE